MSDQTLNRYLASGTTAQRLAFTPNPGTPASGPSPGYTWFDTTLAQLFAWNGSAWVSTAGGGTSPGGSTGQVQVNNSGAFGGVSGGTSGQVLTSTGGSTAPTFQTLPAGLVLLEAHTASASATLDFTTAFASPYDDYLIECLDLLPSNNGAALLARMGTGGGPTWDSGSNYNWAAFVTLATNVTASAGSTGDTSIQLFSIWSSTATNPIYATMRFRNPLSTTAHKHLLFDGTYFRSTGEFARREGAGLYKNTAAVTGLRFLPDSGTIASGTIRVYGVAH